MPAHRPTAAGGFPIAFGAIGGAALGFAVGQPTFYLLAGLALGIVAALLIWWRTRG
jgi:glucose dehydrogenase